MKFNEAVEMYVEGPPDVMSDKDVDTIAKIMMGKTGLDSDAPMEEYYKEIKKNVKSLKKAKDEVIKAMLDTLEETYPKKFGL